MIVIKKWEGFGLYISVALGYGSLDYSCNTVELQKYF